MKKYIKPTMVSEKFVTNEFITACTITESGTGDTYYFQCIAGGGTYGGLYDTKWNLISNDYDSFHACRETHESPVDSNVYIKGYFDPDRRHNNGNELEVYIWLEQETYCNRYGCQTITVDKHATTVLNQESWFKNFS